MQKKLEAKTIIKIAAVIFVLYLCIHYWPSISGVILSVLKAASPLFVGCVIAYALNILMSFYERHFFPRSKKKFVCKARRPVCLLLAIVSLLAVIAVIVALIVPQLVSCVKLLASEIPGAVQYLLEKAEELKIIPEDIMDKIAAIDWQSKVGQIAKTLYSGIGSLMDVVVSVVTSVVSGFATAFVAIIFAIYLLMGKDRIARQGKKLMRRYVSENITSKTEHFLSALNDSFHKFIVGQCTEAVILGVLCTLGMLVLRLPYAPMIGAVTAFTALIPIVGAFLGGAVGAFILLMESPMKAVIFVIFLVILQQLEGNIIYPKVVGSSIGLPGIWVLTAVTVGGGVFGIFGMLMAVPLAACIYRLLRENVNKNSEAKPLNAEAEKKC